MIEAGRYKARAIEWRLGVTGGGNEQIGVLFQLEDGQLMTWYGFFSEKTTERTLDSLETMGWDGVSITDPMGLDRNDVQLVVEHETNDEGKTFPRVRWVNRLGGLTMKEELSGAALQNFKQRMQGTIIARRQSKGAPAPRPQQRQVPPQGRPSSYPDEDYGMNMEADDDVPF